MWELYNVEEDFSQSTDVAASNPDKLREMQALFMEEAERYRVLPIDDRVIERLDPSIAGRPDLMGGRTSLTVYEGMTGMMENAFINVKNQSKTITAEVEIPASGANGVILAQGGRFGGWSLYVTNGRPAYTYNFVGLKEYTVNSSERLQPGKSTIKLEFAYDGNGRGKGGTATISVNGKRVGSGRIERTNANIFSADDAADVGVDEGTNVSSAYAQHDNRFTGKIEKVRVDVMRADDGRRYATVGSVMKRAAHASGTKAITATALSCAVAVATAAAQSADPLPSWNDGKTKQSIVDFVEKVTRQGSSDVCAARRAHRHVRQRRHAVGGAADVFPVSVRDRPRRRRSPLSIPSGRRRNRTSRSSRGT